MKQNVSEILQRQLLLMGYRLENTLSENVEVVKGKKNILEQGSMDMRDDYYGSEEYIQQHDIEMSDKRERDAQKIANSYPNYCWNKGEGTIVPGENEHGLKGVEAIPVGEPEKPGENGQIFCAYRGVGNKLLFLPANVTYIEFNEGSIEEANSFLDYKISGKSSDPILKDDKELQKIYVNYILQNMIKGSVRKFTTLSGVEYGSWNQRKLPSETTKSMSYVFIGYCPSNGGGECYSNPSWRDPRTDYQKFVDEWSLTIQISAAVATAIAGAFTGGGAWVLTAEIIVEMGLGIWAAQREFERGDNIAGTCSIIFGLLPMLKLTKWFPGVSDDVFKSLSQEFAQSGLNATDDVGDFVIFYNGLNKEQKMLLSKLLKQDEYNRNKMLKEIGEALGKEASSHIDDGLKQMIKQNPNLLKSIKFFDRLWVREVGMNIGVMAVSVAFEACCQGLNNTTKMKFSKVYSVIPDSTKKLFTFNVVANAEHAEEIIDNMDQKTFEDNFNVEEGINSMSEWVKVNCKDSVEQAGGTYYEITDAEADMSDDKELNHKIQIITQQQLDSLKNEGWMTMNEFIESGEDMKDYGNPEIYTVGMKDIWLIKKN